MNGVPGFTPEQQIKHLIQRMKDHLNAGKQVMMSSVETGPPNRPWNKHYWYQHVYVVLEIHPNGNFKLIDPLLGSEITTEQRITPWFDKKFISRITFCPGPPTP